MTRILRGAFGCLAVFAFAGGASPVMGDCQPSRDAADCWWPNLAVVLAVASGTAPRDLPYSKAVWFLQVNTGIETRLEMTFVGYHLDRGVLRRDLDRWLKWFLKHYPYIYWDEVRRQYLVDTGARSRGEPTLLRRVPIDGRCEPPQPGDLKELFRSTD